MIRGTSLLAISGLLLLATGSGLLIAQELNDADSFANAGDAGSPWDSESVSVRNGHLAITIPLYANTLVEGFGMNLELQYSSNVWNSYDPTWESFVPLYPDRGLIGVGRVGLGWRFNFPRVIEVLSYGYMPGTTHYYFQGLDGSQHRLHRSNCNSETDFFSFDGSGLKAIRYANHWVVWTADGTKYILGHYIGYDNGSWWHDDRHSWYVTSIQSSERKSNPQGAASHTITYIWEDPQNPSSPYSAACPISIRDDYGRSIIFDCRDKPDEIDWQSYSNILDGGQAPTGIVVGVSVPAPSSGMSPPLKTTFNFNFSVSDIIDPFASRPGGVVVTKAALLLDSISVSDELAGDQNHNYIFEYVNRGPLINMTLPGGATRSYSYGFHDVWRSNQDSFFAIVSGQFEFFPIYGVKTRSLTIDGTTWRWNYTRSTGANCSVNTRDECFSNPVRVVVSGPYNVNDPAISPSTTVYNYRATMEAVGVSDPLDGTLESVQVYAGNESNGLLMQSTTYEPEYDVPPSGGCHPDDSYAHNANNTRMVKMTTVFEDDQKPVHDRRIVEYSDWLMLTENIGYFSTIREYGPEESSLYRIRERNMEVKQNPNGAAIPVTKWSRVLDSNESPVQENNYESNDYGRIVSSRQLYAPGSSPESVDNANDILTTYVYDADTGDLIETETRVAGSSSGYRAQYEWESGYVTRKDIVGSDIGEVNLLDETVDTETGLPSEVREASGGGVKIVYDPLRRPVSVTPLVGSAGPTMVLSYAQGMVSMTVGDQLSQEAILTRTFFDGLGRVKEERKIRVDEQGADVWDTRTIARDVYGSITEESDWAPEGATNVPSRKIERYGSYGGMIAFDPFHRVRRIVEGDGSAVVMDHNGLIRTTTIHGIQGGTVANPMSIDAVTIEERDVFGRTSRLVRPGNTGIVKYEYDEVDQLTRSLTIVDPGLQSEKSQAREMTYDPLGRRVLLQEPERGKIWFGSHSGDQVNSDGYDAIGNVIRYQDSAGDAANPKYYYRNTFDSAGRQIRREHVTEEVPPEVTKIGEWVYDLASNGDGVDSHRGRLARGISYDDDGDVIIQSDYFYQDPFGRLSKVTSTFAEWGTPQAIYYAYDSMGGIGSITYPTTAEACTSDSRCLTVSRLRGDVRSINSNQDSVLISKSVYGSSGALESWRAGNGVTTAIMADPLDGSRLEEMRVENSAGATLWSSGSYSYDGGGNVASIGTDTFIYDAMGRLNEAQVHGPAGIPIYSQVIHYDGFGNIKSKSEMINFEPPEGVIYAIEATTNRVTGINGGGVWAYREDGSLLAQDNVTYEYDKAARLAAVHASSVPVGQYEYDSSDQRVHRKEDHGKEVFYFRDEAGAILSQFSRPSGTGFTPEWDRDFVYLDDLRFAMIQNPFPTAIAWKVTSSETTGVQLGWYSGTEPDIYGYKVYRQDPGASEFLPIYPGASAVTTTSTAFLDSNVVSGSTYVYKIVGVDTAGNEGTPGIERQITFDDTTPPGPPVNLSATATQVDIRLNWSPPAIVPPDFAGYMVYRTTVPGNYGNALNAIPRSALTYRDQSAVPGTMYYYVVTAIDTAGTESIVSNEDNAKITILITQKAYEYGEVFETGAPDNCLIWVVDEIDEPIARYRSIGVLPSDETLYLHEDHLGSIRLVTDEEGEVIETHKYSSYGQELQPSDTASPFHYAGYERDPESSMHYVGARFYRADIGRWLTADPMGGGFMYGNDNPILYRDPNGLDPCTELGLPPCDESNSVTVYANIYYWGPDPRIWITYGSGSGGGGGGQTSTNYREVTEPPQDNPCKGVGAPGFLGSLIPVYGSGRAAVNDFQNGRYVWGALNTAGAISDVVLMKAGANALGKGLWNGGSHSWTATSKWLSRRGWREYKGQNMHHWAIPRGGWGKNVPNSIKNQPFNLTAMSAAAHRALHSIESTALLTIEGSPYWARAAGVSASAKGANASRGNPCE